MADQIVWCDIPVINLDRAMKFYSGVLGVKLAKQAFADKVFVLLPEAERSVSGCLYVSHDSKPSREGPLIYLNCDGRLPLAIANVELNGGKVLQPKHQIGPYGFRAIVLDSEGNRIALHSKT